MAMAILCVIVAVLGVIVAVLRVIVAVLDVSMNRHFLSGQRVSFFAAAIADVVKLIFGRGPSDPDSPLPVREIKRCCAITRAESCADDRKQSGIDNSGNRLANTHEVSVRFNDTGEF